MGDEQQLNKGWALIVFSLALELVGAVVLAFSSLMQVFNDRQNPELEPYLGMVTAQGLGIVALLAMGAVWVVITLIAAFRKRSWSRASNLTIQVLVLAGATGVLQGIMGSKPIGIILLIIAILGIAGTLMTRDRGDQPPSTQVVEER